MSGEYLSSAELHELTGFARVAAQAEWLSEKNIPYLQDGKRVIVSREHVRQRIEGRIVARSSGLNLRAIK